MRNKEIDMTLVSEWKDNFNSGVWTATNCVSPGHSPKIVGGDGIDGFITFANDGAVMNMGEAFEPFEDAAKFLESVFVWEITSEDVKVL
jgi:hypothetical protein